MYQYCTYLAFNYNEWLVFKFMSGLASNEYTVPMSSLITINFAVF